MNSSKNYKAKYIPGFTIDEISKGNAKKGEIKLHKKDKIETIEYIYKFNNSLMLVYKNQKYYFNYK